MTALLSLEPRRMLSDKRFPVLMLILPIAMYLLLTSVFGSGPGAEGESTYLSLMMSMATIGAIGATMMATGPRIARERANGRLRQLKTTPIAGRQVLAAKLLSPRCAPSRRWSWST